jgi:release factor glutamine methyltransferase
MNEAEMVFAKVLNCNRMSLYLDKNLHLDKNKCAAISSVIKRRVSGEPLQYILGETEFMGLEFKVNPDVLIPRPETEILVEELIQLVQNFSFVPQNTRVLDVGTGSGCIAVSLAKFLPGLKMHALDISIKALEVARDNALANDVKIDFILSDLFNSPALKPQGYDIIVSNPPYISKAEIKDLPVEVKYEPAIAWHGGRDGLDFYRRIIPGADNYLRKNGFLALEIGFDQIEAIKNIFLSVPNFKIIKVIKDYSQIERVIIAKK